MMKLRISSMTIIVFLFVVSCDKKNDITNSQNGKVSDIDNNSYKTVVIGKQTWMAENLRVTKLNDSTPLNYEKNNLLWNKNTTSAYCNYNNADNPTKEYGCLYNWYAVNTGKLCPKGYHVPSKSDWVVLNTFLNDSMAALKLKEAGWNHWGYTVHAGTATNSSSFTALPGGERTVLGLYDSQGLYGWWWSSTETSYSGATAIEMNYIDSAMIIQPLSKVYGFSVRCIKD